MSEYLYPDGIRIAGIGCTGCRIVEMLFEKKLFNYDCVVIDSDAQLLQSLCVPNRIHLVREPQRGFLCGPAPEVWSQVAVRQKQELMDEFVGVKLVIFIAGMGGGVGGGVSPVLAEQLHELGIPSVVVVSLPMRMPESVQDTIDDGLRRLTKYSNCVIVIPETNLVDKIPDNAPILWVFNVADTYMYSFLTAVADLAVYMEMSILNKQSFVSMEAKGEYSIMSCGRAEGQDRAVKATSDAIDEVIDDLRKADNLLVCVTTAEEISVKELNFVRKAINAQTSLSQSVNMASVCDESYELQLGVTIIGVGVDSIDTLIASDIMSHHNFL